MPSLHVTVFHALAGKLNASYLDRYRRMLRIAAQAASRSAASRVSGCGERLSARRPDGGGALNTEHIAQPQFCNRLTEARIVAVSRISQHGSLGNSVGQGLADLAQRDLQFGLKSDVVRNLGLPPELAVVGPKFRQI